MVTVILPTLSLPGHIEGTMFAIAAAPDPKDPDVITGILVEAHTGQEILDADLP